ncbi:MAG: hypothetical protein OXM59_12275 [Gammaproteobacteria bacterium]|nr:hypothetical protein [Gammaproteobacteria bacterium]
MKLPTLLQDPDAIGDWGNRYAEFVRKKANVPTDQQIEAMFDDIWENEQMERCELLALGRWKNGGNWNRVYLERNDPEIVRFCTSIALADRSDFERMAVLLPLQGVRYQTASSFLHFAYPEHYPIIDVRVWRTLTSETKTDFTIEQWLEYVAFCRKTSKNYEVSLRVLDRALWTFDKVN